jgi:hypothetical protein
MVHWSTVSQFLELLQGPFENIFQGLNLEKDSVLTAVRGLLRPLRRKKGVDNMIDDADD